VGCSLAILNGQPRLVLLACAYFPAFKKIKFKQIFAAGKAFGPSRDFWCHKHWPLSPRGRPLNGRPLRLGPLISGVCSLYRTNRFGCLLQALFQALFSQLDRQPSADTSLGAVSFNCDVNRRWRRRLRYESKEQKTSYTQKQDPGRTPSSPPNGTAPHHTGLPMFLGGTSSTGPIHSVVRNKSVARLRGTETQVHKGN
jgi:hypothetical protein